MNEFNLEYYRAFRHVAQLGSATKAAEALCLSQPAITHSIRMLEGNLGMKLFVRTSKGMRLTREGEVLDRHVQNAFNALARGEGELKSLSDLGTGQVDIAATETPLYIYLLPKLEAFKKLYPNIVFNITGSRTDENLQMLRTGAVDIAMTVSPMQGVDDLNAIMVNSFCDIFVAGPAFGHLKGRKVPIEEILENPVVSVEKGTNARRHLDLWFAERGIAFAPDYSVRTSTIVMPFVERNIAIGIIPTMFAQELIDRGSVFEIETQESVPPRQIIVFYRKSNISITGRRFIEFLGKE